MPVYECAEHLRGAIQSVIDQTYPDWKLMILDDGSTDPTVSSICSEATHDHRVTYHRFTPTPAERAASVRYATNVNWAVERTDGDYIVVLPGDDYFIPDALERLAAELDGGASVVYGSQWLEWEDGRPRGLRSPAAEPLTDAWHRVDISQAMVLRAAYEEVGGWQDAPPTPDLWRCADGYFWRRLTDAGYIFEPVAGGPVSVKRYRAEGVDARVIAGLTPWV